MKTRWYFIIAGAAVAGFAVWYQDYERRDSLRRATLTAEQADARAAAVERRRAEEEKALTVARKAAEDLRREREARAQREAQLQAQREGWQSQLVVAREETAALRVNRERLVREIAVVEQHLARQQDELTAIASEDKFLQNYITNAHANAARLEAVAWKAENFRIAAAADPEPGRRTR